MFDYEPVVNADHGLGITEPHRRRDASFVLYDKHPLGKSAVRLTVVRRTSTPFSGWAACRMADETRY